MANETINIDLTSWRVFNAFQPVTNGEDWVVVINLFNGGSAYDLDGETATMSIRAQWGSEVATATGVASDNAAAVTSILTFTFRESTFSDLAPGSYTVAARIVESPATRQFLHAKLPVRSSGFE